jgi:hypothetical protein
LTLAIAALGAVPAEAQRSRSASVQAVAVVVPPAASAALVRPRSAPPAPPRSRRVAVGDSVAVEIRDIGAATIEVAASDPRRQTITIAFTAN